MKLNASLHIYRWKHSTIESHLLGVLQGIAEITDGLVTVCSLGFLCSNFDLTVSAFRAKRLCNHLKKQQREVKQ